MCNEIAMVHFLYSYEFYTKYVLFIVYSKEYIYVDKLTAVYWQFY